MSDSTHDQESFADLFAEEDVVQKSLTPGQKIKATIVAISGESVFLDVGEKSEGFLDRKELEDETGEVSLKAGDSLEVYFLSASPGELLFTTRIGGGSTSRAHLEEAYRNSIPLEGFVKKEIKGGFEVTIAGNIRTFCPYSQMGLKRVSDPEAYVGQHLLFKITQYSEGGRNIILSRRIILEEERQEKLEELRENLKEGMSIKGKITSLKKFGAFVDIGSIEGLIPISEVGWSRTEDITEVLTEGQDVEVVALKLDWENERFSFSLKQALPDPWLDISNQLPVGSFQTGTVVRLTKFGAFVNLAEGIDGLIHISKLGGGRRINHPKEVVEEGQSVEVKIEEINQDEKRISLALAGEESDEPDTAESTAGDYKKYLEKSSGHPASPSQSTGTLGDLLQAKLDEKKSK